MRGLSILLKHSLDAPSSPQAGKNRNDIRFLDSPRVGAVRSTLFNFTGLLIELQEPICYNAGPSFDTAMLVTS